MAAHGGRGAPRLGLSDCVCESMGGKGGAPLGHSDSAQTSAQRGQRAGGQPGRGLSVFKGRVPE